MKKILIVGGGRQGSLIAKEFVKDRCNVTIADIRDPNIEGTEFIYFEALEYNIVHSPEEASLFFRPFDLVVNTLPGDLSFVVTRCIAWAGVKCVDLGFSHENAFTLDSIARKTGAIIVPDCGLAPGLPNYLIGNELRGQKINEVKIYVGGVAEDPQAPYGYVCSWSPADLKTEYIRPAKIVVDGEVVERDPLATPEKVSFEFHNDMEAFYSDGLRTLTELKNQIPNMSESTLRWPGHVKQIKELLNSDKDFVEEIVEKCSYGHDKVVMIVSILGQDESIAYKMSVSADTNGNSAMSKTTAYTCYATGHILLSNVFTDKGVHPPEHLGFHSPSCLAILDKILNDRGITINQVSMNV